MFFFSKLKKDTDDFQKLSLYYKAELELNELFLKENAIFNSNFKAILNKYLEGEAQKDTVLYALKQLYDRQVYSVKKIIRRRYDLSVPYEAGSLYSAADNNCEAFLELIEINYFDAVANINSKFDRLDKRITQQSLIKWEDSVVRRERAENELRNKLKIDDVAFAKMKNKAASSQERKSNSTYAINYNKKPPRLLGVTVSATVFKDRWKPPSDWLFCGHYRYKSNYPCRYDGGAPSRVKEQIPLSSWVKEQIPLSIDYIYNKLPPKETNIIDWGYGEGVHFVSLHDSLYAITVNQGYDDTSGSVFIHSTSKSTQTD